MQDGSQFVPFAVFAGWMIILTRTWRGHALGKKTRVTLMEYQGGILFSRGVPQSVVGPGGHTVWQGRDFLLYVDTRPRPMNFEGRTTGLADHSAAAYDVFATVRITDVKKAIYSARDPFQGAAAAILCTSRSVINGVKREDLTTDLESVTRNITERLQRRLEESGFVLESLRISNIKLIQVKQAAVAGFGQETTATS